MATFAEIDSSNKVIRALIVDDKDTQDADGNEVEAIGVNYLSKFLGGTWLKTDKYTRGGVHVKGGTPFRKNYGGPGFTYDETRDAFISPQPYPSWTFNETTCLWDPPVPWPEDAIRLPSKNYMWNEEARQWDPL